MNLKITRALVRTILQYPERYEWSVQGLGLLRLYLGTSARLHIWDSRLAYPGASGIHDHSWDLKSTIISGELVNRRFVELLHGAGDRYWKGRIIAGYNARMLNQVEVGLYARQPEVYTPGDSYEQRAEEIHLTSATPGTVTIMEREQGDPDAQVHVYWPVGEEWGDARPRKAHDAEVKMVTENALKLMGAE